MPSAPLTTADVQNFIDEHNIDAHLIGDIGHTPTVPAAAQALGVHPDQIVKTLLFLVQTASDPSSPQPVVVISNGTNRVDKRILATHFGVGKKRVKLAAPEVVLEVLGYPAGGVPPFAHRTEVSTVLDHSVVDLIERFDDRVYAGGGDDVTMLELAVSELQRVVQPEVVALSPG